MPRRVLISVKYNHDQVVERSLAAFLAKDNYETFRHEGTVDLMNRVDLPPFIVDGPLTLMAPSLFPSGRQTKPPDVSSALIRYLVNQVCSYPVIVIVWSAPYANSFWCQLELQAATLARKPIVVIHSDYHPLPSDFTQGTRHRPCEIIEIDGDYRTSDVFAAIEHLFSVGEAVSVDVDSVSMRLEKYSTKNYRGVPDAPGIGRDERVRYEEVVRVLRNADHRGELRPAIASLVGTRALEYPELQGETLLATQRLVESGRGEIDVGFRRYLEGAASGVFEAALERWYYTYLLGEILDFRFLPPGLPQRLEEYYVRRIRNALVPPKQVDVESLIEDLIGECLFTREFVEYFGHLLADVRESSGPLVAGTYWELCTARVSEAI
jgi:hypothetical protein